MPKVSAGLLMYRVKEGSLEVLLVHPGGPLWAKKDLGAWTIPKGEVAPGEDHLLAARREFREETGFEPQGEFVSSGEVKQKGGKLVRAWAFQGDLDPQALRSNTFRMEWPPRSGRWQEYPEIDRAAFFNLDEAARRINPAQAIFLQRLKEVLKGKFS